MQGLAPNLHAAPRYWSAGLFLVSWGTGLNLGTLSHVLGAAGLRLACTASSTCLWASGCWPGLWAAHTAAPGSRWRQAACKVPLGLGSELQPGHFWHLRLSHKATLSGRVRETGPTFRLKKWKSIWKWRQHGTGTQRSLTSSTALYTLMHTQTHSKFSCRVTYQRAGTK